MSHSQLITSCPDCVDEIEFALPDSEGDTVYLDEVADTMDVETMKKMDKKRATCPRCGNEIRLEMVVNLKAVSHA